MTASHAVLAGSLMFSHIRPARVKSPCGRFDQRVFCSVFDQSNCTDDFSVALSVARNAFAALTIAAVPVEPAVVLAVAPALALALADAPAVVPVLSDEAHPPAIPTSASATPAAMTADLFRLSFTAPFHEMASIDPRTNG